MVNTKNQLWDHITAILQPKVRKEVLQELGEELKQEAFDDAVEELGRTCAVCSEEIEFMAETDPTEIQPNHSALPPPLPHY